MIDKQQPLAERMRPKTLQDFVGQAHLTNENGIFSKIVASGRLPSLILWGHPGTGKTTLAYILSQTLQRPFYTLSAVSSGVKDVREVIEKAKSQRGVVLFIDEIHRFSKSQQDALLAAVEKGTITLIGATTENPSFEVIPALLSRCQVYTLKPHSVEELTALMERAIKEDEELNRKNIVLQETEALMRLSGGDARKLLNLLEIVAGFEDATEVVITNDLVLKIAQQHLALYDKSGEQHYDIISAFIKSMRGSDPNAAVYWLARMIAGGEDALFIARRMLILASEDIGNANPNALLLAQSCFEAVHVIGYPEARIILSQTAIYLATSPKSNASYTAIDDALAAVEKHGNLPVPLHLRNAPTRLMKQLGYGKDYQYAHAFEGNFVHQDFLPLEIANEVFYQPMNNTKENEIRKRLQQLWGNKYKY